MVAVCQAYAFRNMVLIDLGTETDLNILPARVIMDRETGRSRGFGFITYATTEDASSAIQAMDGQVLSAFCCNLFIYLAEL